MFAPSDEFELVFTVLTGVSKPCPIVLKVLYYMTGYCDEPSPAVALTLKWVSFVRERKLKLDPSLSTVREFALGPLGTPITPL